MPTLEDVYQKFGFASEAAQLLETQLGNLHFEHGAFAADLFDNPDSSRATDLVNSVNRKTLGQLIKNLNLPMDSTVELESLLTRALKDRNRLAHSFYREHNFRRNSDEGRALMMEDLESIHCILLDAYKAVMRLSGIDLDRFTDEAMTPTRHLSL